MRVNPGSPSYSSLQFAVGTANLYGTATGLNVVSTLRQPNGTSATGVNTPAITGPFTFAAPPVPAPGGASSDPYTTAQNFGPSLSETSGTAVISGTPQSVQPGTPFCDATNPPAGFTLCPSGIAPNTTTFGQSGGVFAMGLLPSNHTANTGQSYSYAPYAQPFYDSGAAPSHPLLVPWGGPPAFDPDKNGMGTRDGLIALGSDSFRQPYFLGVGEGISIFENVNANVGPYMLSVQIATLESGGAPNITTLSAQARLTSPALLPTVAAPLVTPNASGDGGANFSVVLDPRITEAYVQIVDYGPGGGPTKTPSLVANCQGPKGPSFAPVYYTVRITGSGAYMLGAKNGPNTNLTGGVSNLTPSPSICTAAQNSAAGTTNAGDSFTVQLLGFDYPIYQAALGLTQATAPQSPPITGLSGQSDTTVSIPVEEDDSGGGVYSATPLSTTRRPH